MEQKNNQQPGQINIELSEDVAQGTYSNLSIIAHSSNEFVLDFIAVMPNVQKAKVKSRIIMNAENAKRLLMALQENISKFESKYGPISLHEKKMQIPFSLDGFKGEA